MEQFVYLVAEELVNAVECGVLLGGAELAGFVCVEEADITLCLAVIAALGLTAAADTTVGASHNLDEVEELFALFDLLDELISIAETVCNSNLQSEIACGNLKCLDAFKTAYTAFSNLCNALAGGSTDNVADNCLGNAAGNTEDDACAGVGSKGSIGLGVGKCSKVYACFLDHSYEFLRSKYEINESLVVLNELRTLCLCLLSGAGHNSDGVDILILILLADKSTEHLHGRTAGGNLRHQVGIGVLNVLDPAGAAGGEHRQLLAGVQLIKELCGLFHNGKVSGEGGVEYVVNAHALESGGDLAHYRLSCGDAELFTNADSDCGSNLNCDLLAAVVDCLPHIGDIVLNGDSAGGADCCALAAANALGLCQRLAETAGYEGIKAAVAEVDSTDVLNLRANSYALAAEDALAGIANDRGRRVINRLFAVLNGEAYLVNTVALCVLLQLALAGLVAGSAFSSVACEQQLNQRLTILTKLCGVGLDDHAVFGNHGAAGLDAAALIFYNTQTAAAVYGKVFTVAKVRDVDAVIASNLKNISFVLKIAANAVNNHSLHLIIPPLLRASGSRSYIRGT